MRVEIDAPSSCFGTAVIGSQVTGDRVAITARVPLAEMFDDATQLGSLTGGRGSHSMSADGYELVPEPIVGALVEREAS